jgi:hypothetical protein
MALSFKGENMSDYSENCISDSVKKIDAETVNIRVIGSNLLRSTSSDKSRSQSWLSLCFPDSMITYQRNDPDL